MKEGNNYVKVVYNYRIVLNTMSFKYEFVTFWRAGIDNKKNFTQEEESENPENRLKFFSKITRNVKL